MTNAYESNSWYFDIRAKDLADCSIRMIPNVKQILLFSATFPEEVMRYAQQFSPNANQISLKRDELTVSGIKQMFMDCPSEEGKYDILTSLYGLMTIGSSIIFVKVRSDLHGFVTLSLTNDLETVHCFRNC